MAQTQKIEKSRRCDHCGRPITNAGRPSKSGRYWCSAAKCRAEKQRVSYRERRGFTAGEAPTECSKCGVPLKPRATRVGDIPNHRWCQRTACQIHRQGIINQRELNPGMAEVQNRVDFLHRAMLLPRVTCGICGFEDCVDGYRHPVKDGAGVCFGTGDSRVKGDDARAVWVYLYGPPAWQVEMAARMAEEESRPQEVHPA